LKIFRALVVTIGITLCFISLGCGTTTTVQATGETSPSISQVIPQSVLVGSGNVTMKVMGSNFTSQTVILWNGSQLATSVIDSNTLAASVQGGSFMVPGTAHVQVQDSQTGQESGSLSVVIASSGTSAAPLVISTTSLASGVAGTSYSVSLAATGGTAAYTWSISSGQLPSGLSLAASTGVLSGTPTTSGTFSFGVTVTDSGSPQQSTTATLALSIGAGVQKPATLVLGSATLPGATAAQSYSGPLTATGGTAPYLWAVSSGQLPSGLSIAASTGVISGTPTTSGAFSFTVTVTDSGSPVQTASASTSIVVAPTTLAITSATLASGTNGAAYAQTLQASGGTPGYTWSITSGSLPGGLTLATSSGAISGTPTASGTFNFTVAVADSGSPAQTKSVAATIVVAPNFLTITTSALPTGTAGTAYSQALQASGGTPGYTWSITSGSLPAGMTLASASGVISGTPTASGTSNFTVTVSDSGNPAQTKSAATSIVVAPNLLTITTSLLSTGTAGTAYSQALQASGGTPGYTWSITSGSLPTGLTLASTTGVISGTPTASGTSNFTVTVSDSGSPAQTKSAATSIVVGGTVLGITSSTLAAGTNAAAYSQTLQASGGTPGYTWSISAGSLPAGLTLAASSGVISGTPTTNGTSNFTVTVSDSGNPAQTKSAATSIVVAAKTLAVASSTLAAGTNGTPYSQTLLATGGTPGYTWSISAGSLPAGLTLASASGVISGTPTASGTSNFTVTVSDSGNPAQTKSAATSIVVGGTVLAITSSALASGTNGTAYSQTLQASGGTPGYTWSISTGSLPAGLTLAASSGIISGTPTTIGTSNFTVTISDSGNPAQTKAAATSIVVGGTVLAITSSTLAAGTNGTAYSQALQASGGTPGYTWSVSAGSLPAGLTLASATGTISGTPTTSGTSNFTATVTDRGNPAQTKSAAQTIVVAPSALAITASTLSSGTGGVAYSQTLQASGGSLGYTWSITSGSLPAGLSLAGSTGAISGTPTAGGTSNFTVTVTDSGNPAQTKSAATTIVVAPSALTLAAAVLPSGTVATAYSMALQASGGTPAYTWSLSSGSLPGGLTQGASTGVISGTPTASGTFNFTATVSDNGNPVQTKSAAMTITVVAAAVGSKTWYVRTDGGTATQCTGTTNAPYSGSGTGQACAVSHPFWLLDQWNFTWLISPNDTVKFEDVGPYYIGQTLNGLGTNWPFCVGQNNACILPPLPNGSSMLGVNAGAGAHNSTHSALVNPTQFIALNDVFSMINIQGSVGVDVEDFDLSQPDMCTSSGTSIPDTLHCHNGVNNYPIHGLVLSYLTGDGPSDSTVRDLQIHGLANEAVTGGKMNLHGVTNTMTFSDIYMYGNANTGWNGDAGGCTNTCESTGTINLSYINAYWNGCMEIKPNGGTVGGNGVTTCVDQGMGGNGDNIVMIATGGTWNWNHVITKWGMQDGVDLLHTGDDIASGVVINMNDVDSEGNEGQQWKVGGTTTGTNMRLITNCERSQFPFAPNPSNYAQYATLPCRAFAGVTLSVSPGHTISITNTTIVGNGNPEIDIDCYTNGPGCPANSYSVVLKDDLLLGYADPITGTKPGGLYWGGELADPFANTGSAISNMLWTPNTMRASSGNGPTTGCSQDPSYETGVVCLDPLLIGESSVNLTTLDNFNINLLPTSPAIGAGILTGVLMDFNGIVASIPGIGAIE
jgi:hypothetical protein